MDFNEQVLISVILNEMSDGVLVIGTDGRIRLHNRAAEQILALPNDALNEHTVADLADQTRENDTFFADVLDAVSQRKTYSKTVPYFRENEMLYLRITAEPLSRGGEELGMIVQITDITEATMLFIANKRLAGQVIDLMNSFVEVMVTAIEEKSAYNANHTKSMVRYATNYLQWLAEQGRLTEFTAENTAPFLMSIWLHDIGKLLVPQEIMDKPTRLGTAEKDVRHRIETAKLMLRIESLKHPERAAGITAQRAKLDEAEALIFSANDMGVLDDSMLEQLRTSASLPCPAADGSVRTLLTDSELESITVRRGTLTAGERRIIESHVTYTGKLLSKVEFRGDYKPVSQWAAGHHELLDGSGYPDRLSGDQIPPETRLITIIDIYDALTAEDRPYKPPMEPQKAFAILRDMAEKGKLDAGILESFIRSGAWKNVPQNQTERKILS